MLPTGVALTVESDPAIARRQPDIALTLAGLHIVGILCSGLLGSKLTSWTGYTEKPLDAIGAVIASALAVQILTFLNKQDIGSLVALITRRGGSGGTK